MSDTSGAQAPLGYTQDPRGDKSAMRFALMYAAVPLGWVIALGGLCGWIFLDRGDGVGMVAIGAGLVAGGMTTKMGQAHAEAKMYPDKEAP
jgi:hypothetical protein